MVIMMTTMMINHDADHVDDEYDDADDRVDDDYDDNGDDDIWPVDVVEYFRRLVVDDIVLPDLGTVLESALSSPTPFIISQDSFEQYTSHNIIIINKQNEMKYPYNWQLDSYTE